MKKRIAIVVQRYGLEVNGGSEYSCRLVSERLKQFYDVDVLTTKAIDYVTWENHYSPDVENINGVTVRRFKTDQPRISDRFNKCNEKVMTKAHRNIYDELDWMREQGPVSFDLLEYIQNNQHQYEKIIYFTYLYFTTFFGLQQTPEKSILVPTAHDEPYIYFSIFKSLFHLPRHIIFLTEEEKEFVHRYFGNNHIPHDVAGLGLDVPEHYLTEEQFREKFNIRDRFMIYVGRIDESKGCREMFDFYLNYKKDNPSAPKLVLMGKNVLEIPKDPNIISLGFVSEEEKYGGIQSAELLIMPSKFESFSIVVLESLYLSRPVLVNGHSEVLVGHCNRSNAGLYYSDYDDFKSCLDLMLSNGDLRQGMGQNGKKYVEENYIWAKILEKFIASIER